MNHNFQISKIDYACSIYVDSNSVEYEGLKRVAACVAEDIEVISEQNVSILNKKEQLNGEVISPEQLELVMLLTN